MTNTDKAVKRQPRRRNRAATEQRLVAAVGEVLDRDGVLGLGVNSIANQANADKVLIYRYFGDLDNLYTAYAAKTRLWPGITEVAGDAPAVLRALSSIDRLTLLLGNLCEALPRYPRGLDLLAWQVFERNALTRALAAQQATLNHEMLDLSLIGSALAPDDLMPKVALVVDAVIMDCFRARQGAGNQGALPALARQVFAA